MTDRRPPTPQGVYRAVLELVSDQAARDTDAAGEDPEASKARWLLPWLRLIKPKGSR